MPVDPVCGIELDEDIALIHDHNGKNFIFAVMVVEKFSLRNHGSIKITFRLEMLHTFYKILNY